MSAELLINVTPQETRVALIENGLVQEIFVERTNHRGIVGNIYLGRIERVLPGMQAAFVDIGLQKAAFLHASDIIDRNAPASAPSAPPSPSATLADRDRRAPLERPPLERPNAEQANISELVSEGQVILVQVIKDPLGTKGARLTTHISIPSRYMVYIPDGNGAGVSQRIDDEEERERLRATVTALAGGTYAESASSADIAASAGPTVASASAEIVSITQAQIKTSQTPAMEAKRAPGGYIVRTAAESASAEQLAQDIEFLHRLWTDVRHEATQASAPALIHADLPLAIRTLRETLSNDLEKIRVDSRESYRKVIDFAHRFTPEIVSRIDHYPGERPIFDLYSVEDEIQRALDRKVQLKSGGYLILDQTEAMTTIDVNTGAYVGRRNLEETIFKTNLEAAHAIARQLRLRNLGGIIIIDFIDMHSEEHKRLVHRALEKNLERDPMKTQVSEVSSLGLVQMTRKRTRESVEHVLCDQCGTCGGRGYLKSAETVCYEIFREILREARQYDAKSLLVLASNDVIDRMIDEESSNLAELEEFIGKPIKLQTEPMYTQTQYDVVLM